MTRFKPTSGIIFTILAAISWGTIGIAVAWLYQLTPTSAFSVGFWRLMLSAPLLLALSRAYAGPRFWHIQRQDVGALSLMGVAFALYQVCYFAAIPYIGVAAAVLINICSAPIFVAVLSNVVLKEEFTFVIGGALIGAVLGALLLVGGTPETQAPGDLLWGSGLALGAGFSYSVVAITARMVAARYHPVQPVAMAFTLSALLLLPIALYRGLDINYPLLGWGLLAYLAIVPTTLGYILYLRGMRSITATISSIVALLEPLISTLCAVAFLGETLSVTGVLGGVLLLGSVAFLYLHQKPVSTA